MKLTNDIALNYFKMTYANGKPANGVFSVLNSNNTISTFIADLERTSDFDYRNSKYNKNCLLSIDNSDNKQQLIHQLYPVEQCFYKSAIYRTGKAARLDNTYDFLNTTNHDISSNSRLSSFVQVDNTMYALEAPSKYGRYDLTCDIYSYISANNGLIKPLAPKISTAIYDKVKIKKALADDNITELQKNAVKENLYAVQYNMLYEIPGNIYNDYESGNIAANTFKCKNNFNAEYDMSHTSDAVLSNARTYHKIDNCNDLIYLTYKDNANYADRTSDPNIQDTSCEYGYKCDKVEVLSKVNRFSNVIGHKTNAYSIIVYSNLFTSISKNSTNIASTISNNMKNEIKNVITDIVKKLAPISTLLVNVTINDIDS